MFLKRIRGGPITPGPNASPLGDTRSNLNLVSGFHISVWFVVDFGVADFVSPLSANLHFRVVSFGFHIFAPRL